MNNDKNRRAREREMGRGEKKSRKKFKTRAARN